jgi:hypothetical protein
MFMVSAEVLAKSPVRDDGSSLSLDEAHQILAWLVSVFDGEPADLRRYPEFEVAIALAEEPTLPYLSIEETFRVARLLRGRV